MNLLKLKDRLPRRQESDFLHEPAQRTFVPDNGFCSEPHFDRMLYLERKRTERSKKPFLLMLLKLSDLFMTSEGFAQMDSLKDALNSCIRETDVKGWYRQNEILGIIFTEMGTFDETVKKKIFLKIQDKLGNVFGPESVRKIKISFHAFPEEYDGNGKKHEWFNCNFYPELAKRSPFTQTSLLLKRAIDLIGSLLGLVILFPVFLIIALAIKFSSRGPVLFKQERVGQGGKRFIFLKFRSMYTNCDERTHKEYITKFISEGKEEASNPNSDGEPIIFKMKDDCRVAPLGRLLRKTSLDELPQFINVLKGEMSLIGPRPPIPYECELYDIWHRRRLLSVKPGITGLWQVEGRSRRTFDDMVRLDLKYINEWSLWLDLKILFKTPWVMVSGNGGY